MKCPNPDCGFENREGAKFCGKCGNKITLIVPEWKWGSMIASLVLIFIYWFTVAFLFSPLLFMTSIILLLLGFPATIYLMHKERTTGIKYGLAWILFPILMLLLGRQDLLLFGIIAVPAIVIDFIYVKTVSTKDYETFPWKWGSMIASLVLILIFWGFILYRHYHSYGGDYDYDQLIIPLLFGISATIYLMYKERKAKIKYGLAWILFPILTLFFSMFDMFGQYDDATMLFFFILAIPAIIIDYLFIFKIFYKIKQTSSDSSQT